MSFDAATPPFGATTEPFASPNRIEFDIAVTSDAGGLFTIDEAFLLSYFAAYPRPPAMLVRLFSQSYPTDEDAGDALRALEYTAVPSIAVPSAGTQPPARRLSRNSSTGKPEFVLSSGNSTCQWRVCLRLPVSQVG
jgi:hypothetical protein